MTRLRLTVSLTGLALMLAGCGSQPAATAHVVIDGNLAKSYSSVAALLADSSAVVEVTTTDHRSVSYVGRIPYTVTTATVRRVLRGILTASSIQVRQLGMPSTTSLQVDNPQPLLSSGSTYVAFVTPFTFGDGRPTGQYVVVGAGQGLYSVHSGEVTQLDSESPGLGGPLSVDELGGILDSR